MPIRSHVALALAFAVLGAIRLTIPGAPFFDEVALPARRAQPVHARRGDEPRTPASGQATDRARHGACRGMIRSAGGSCRLLRRAGLFAAMRAIWFASQDRLASVLAGVLLLTGFPLLVQARIAMLDIFMAGFIIAGFVDVRGRIARERDRAATAGDCRRGLGRGDGMQVERGAAGGPARPRLPRRADRAGRVAFRRLPARLADRRHALVGGGDLARRAAAAGLCAELLAVPVLRPGAGRCLGPVLAAGRDAEAAGTGQGSHPYQSTWPQWVGNWRAIWYLYEPADGASAG